MIQVNIKLVHSFLRISYLFSRVLLFVGWYILSTSTFTVDVRINLFSYNLFDYFFELDLSPSSLLFMSVVSLITSVVLIFAYSYIRTFYHSFIFLLILNLFVCSMIFVISFKNFFIVMLGWDGLGVISFFLILYYQSPYSIFSAWFTILINRLGDCFLIIAIVMLLFDNQLSVTINQSRYSTNNYVLLLILGLITKRALFPFSPWLPVAIRAPTPISRLVHSSTLVTAGLYLIIRIEVLFLSYPLLPQVIIWISLFTRIYAGMRALFEVDLKKLVALSTLRHLGFIGIRLFRGIVTLAYFHLLAHALFKRLLFMGVGDWISVGHHYQESRSLRGGMILTPLSSFVILSSVLRLLGIPFMVGFYSKDIILESLFYSDARYLFLFVVYINVFFTFNYTLRVVKYVVSSLNQASPMFLVLRFIPQHYFILTLLRITRFIFPSIYFYSMSGLTILSIPFFHWLPFIILFLAIIYIYSQFTFLDSQSLRNSSLFLTFFFSHIIGMSTLYSSFVSFISLKLTSSVFKFLEVGMLRNLTQHFHSDTVLFSSSFYYKIGLYFLPFVSVLIIIFMIV